MPSTLPPTATIAQARVTVVMPVYNAERYLDESVGSLQAQTFKDWELLAIDDGSTDASLQVLERLAATDARIRILRNPQNLGLSRTRNRGLDEARGEFLGWLDADDIALPTRLEKQVRFLSEHQDFGLVGSWVEEIDSDGVALGRRWVLNAPAACVPVLMLFRCYCSQSAVLLRRALVGDERYDELYPPSEDYEFHARLSRRLPMWNLPEVLCLYRRHAASTSTVQNPRALATMRQLIRVQLKSLEIDPTEEELRLHTDLGNLDSRHRADPAASEAWLRHLLQANAQHRAYEPVAFARTILTQWLYICQATAGSPLARLRTFLRAKLLRDVHLPAGQWAALVFGAAQKAWQSWYAPSAVPGKQAYSQHLRMGNTLLPR